jgi:hypothetical protein
MTSKIRSLIEHMSDNLEESSLSRIWKKTQNHSCGTITSFRGSKTKTENKKTNSEMLTYLMGKGYSVTKIKGSYIENFGSKETQKEVGEESFFVCNQDVDGHDDGMLEKDLVALGRKYDQDSVLIIPYGGKGAYLRGTSKREDAYPSYNKKEVVGGGKFGKASGAFLSRIRGREFSFEDVEPMQTINGIRGQKIFVDKLSREMDFD